MKKQKITRIKCSYSLLQTIKILREKSHLNRDEISLQMGKARNYISNLENGKNEYIKINDFRNLIKILLPQITFELTDENLVLIEKAINENHGHIENVLMDINNIDVLRLNRELLVSELDKQLIYRKLADVEEIFYDKVDRECNLPKDTMYKIITGERKPVAGEFGVNLKCELQPDLVYTSLKKVFTYLDFIIPAKLDTYLNMLGVVVPNIANVEKIDNLNVCYKTDKELGNMGEYLEKWYSEEEDRYWARYWANERSEQEYFDSLEYRQSQNENNYIDDRKQELHNKINQASEVLHSVVNIIDPDDYTGTIQYEAIVQTATELLLTKGGLRVVQDLFQYPLHKLNENDIKSICDVVNDKLDFQYVILEEDKNKTSEQMNLFDVLYQPTHLDCVDKESVPNDGYLLTPLVHSDNNKKQD